MNEQERNKKLAEWARFKQLHEVDGFIWDEIIEPPNFTQSLDACFKWLYPKLGELVHDPYSILELWIRELVYRKKEPALALCQVIEKLIDSRE